MSHENKLLLTTAEKLGVTDSTAIKKAEEYLRVYHNKGAVKALSDSAKTVLCLDLATRYLGLSFDTENARRLSGLSKQSAYQNQLHVVEKLLGVERLLTINEVCVQCGCTFIKDTAEEIWQQYKATSNQQQIKDFSHPQYVTAAVYTACKLKNVKVEREKFLQLSRLKASQWKEITTDYQKFVESTGLSGKKTKQVNMDELAEELEQKVVLKKRVSDEDDVEEYEVWKARILKEAYEALGIKI